MQVIVVESCKSALVGKYFHSFEGGKVRLQGYVASQESEGLFLVETFDWCCGESFDFSLVKLADMLDWRFYETAEGMRFHWERRRRVASEMMTHGD